MTTNNRLIKIHCLVVYSNRKIAKENLINSSSRRQSRYHWFEKSKKSRTSQESGGRICGGLGLVFLGSIKDDNVKEIRVEEIERREIIVLMKIQHLNQS